MLKESDAVQTYDYEVEHSGVKYHCVHKHEVKISSYDRLIGSIEQSHNRSIDYSIIDSYDGKTEELDFTFAKPLDRIKIKCEEDINSIKLNSANLHETSISATQPLIININVDTKLMETLVEIKSFITRHRDIIKNVNLVGVDKSLESPLGKMISTKIEEEVNIDDSKSK